jgi:hypothetical protein
MTYPPHSGSGSIEEEDSRHRPLENRKTDAASRRRGRQRRYLTKDGDAAASLVKVRKKT